MLFYLPPPALKKSGITAHACSLSIESAEAGRFQVGGQLGLHNETMSQTDMGVWEISCVCLRNT